MIPFSPATLIVAKTRRIFRRFEEARATSPGYARTPDELGLYHGLIFRRLVNQGVLIEASPGRYYLSHENQLEYNTRRQARIKIILGVIVIIIAIAVIFNIFGKY